MPLVWHISNPKYVPLKPFWCIFPSQNQQNVKILPEILIFQDPLIIETRNKCHWIWHVSNPKYAPLKPLWCIFPSQNQQNVKFLPEILIFQKLLIVESWNLCHWIMHALHPKYVPLKPFWGTFFKSKSTKCEIFAWNFDFAGTTYHRYLKPVPLDLACLKP